MREFSPEKMINSLQSSGFEGRLLTIIEASFPDPSQREAVKSLARKVVKELYLFMGQGTKKEEYLKRFLDTAFSRLEDLLIMSGVEGHRREVMWLHIEGLRSSFFDALLTDEEEAA